MNSNLDSNVVNYRGASNDDNKYRFGFHFFSGENYKNNKNFNNTTFLLKELIKSPALLASIFGGILVGIITAFLLLFFIIYRMRSNNSKKANNANIISKINNNNNKDNDYIIHNLTSSSTRTNTKTSTKLEIESSESVYNGIDDDDNDDNSDSDGINYGLNYCSNRINEHTIKLMNSTSISPVDITPGHVSSVSSSTSAATTSTCLLNNNNIYNSSSNCRPANSKKSDDSYHLSSKNVLNRNYVYIKAPTKEFYA
jgi:hypothetical protein